MSALLLLSFLLAALQRRYCVLQPCKMFSSDVRTLLQAKEAAAAASAALTAAAGTAMAAVEELVQECVKARDYCKLRPLAQTSVLTGQVRLRPFGNFQGLGFVQSAHAIAPVGAAHCLAGQVRLRTAHCILPAHASRTRWRGPVCSPMCTPAQVVPSNP